MAAEFTETQVGKRVVDQNGVEVGTVQGVRNGDLLVEVGPDADPETLAELNWDGTVNQGVHQLLDRHVSNVDEDTIRLRV